MSHLYLVRLIRQRRETLKLDTVIGQRILP